MRGDEDPVHQGCGGHGGRGAEAAPARGLSGGAAAKSRRLTGQAAYHAGLSAEDQVAQAYLRAGARLVAQRWRGRAGEIDLILREGDRVVFVEVKCAASHAVAATKLGAAQIARLQDAAVEFLAAEPQGTLTEARLDLALVDGAGRIEVIANVTGF